MSVTKEDKTD